MAKEASKTSSSSASREEVVGYHKGSLNTLLAERNELVRIVQVTESLIQAHLKALQELGVKIESGAAAEKKK